MACVRSAVHHPSHARVLPLNAVASPDVFDVLVGGKVLLHGLKLLPLDVGGGRALPPAHVCTCA